MTDEMMTCKCGATFPDWREHQHRDACPYVRCDDPGCAALKEPHTLQELVTAHDHWRRHHWLGGCSHGC